MDEIRATLGEITSRLRDRRGALLIGSGCSASAGIPTARGFVKLIKQKYRKQWEKAQVKDYAHCMAQLDPAQRRGLIRDQVKNKRVNLSHLAIAALLKQGKVDRVITTNFDSLLTQACSLMGVETAVYDVDALSSNHFRVLDIGMPAVFFVHGQYYGFTQQNAPEDYTKSHAMMLRKLIRTFSETHTWIVVGYSAENDPSSKPLLDQRRFDCGLFWVGHDNREPAKDVQNNLLLQSKRAFLVRGFDADTFFSTLSRELNCDPMEMFRKPFSHLDSLLTHVELGTRRLRNKAQEKTRQTIDRAIQWFEEGARPIASWRKPAALKVPDASLGLVLALPIFRQLDIRGFASPEDAVSDVSGADFRWRIFQTNWGPAIAAIEHHKSKLQHCWIVCTPQVPAEHYELMRQVIATVVPAAECHKVNLRDPTNILDVQETIAQIYLVDAWRAGLKAADVVADITGGLSAISGGMVLATLDEDRPIEYLTQGIKLVQDGRALTPDEIRDRQVLVAIHTNGEMVRGALLQAS